jgi:DNA-binding MarR family transcriptional regulator
MNEGRVSAPLSPEHLRGLLHRHSLMTRRFREVIARTNDIPESEMTALAQLSVGRALTPGELGNALALTSGGTTALIDRLVQRGYITRTPHPHDMRSVLVASTPRAIAEVGSLYAPLAASLDQLARTLSEHDRAIVAAYLEAAGGLTHEATEAVQRHQADRYRDRVIPSAPQLWA